MSDWIIPRDRLPRPQSTVLVAVQHRDGTRSRLRALFVAPRSIPCPEHYIDADGGGPNGWFVRGGWYEDSLYCGQAPIPDGDRVLRWCPLPEFPPEVYGIDYGPDRN